MKKIKLILTLMFTATSMVIFGQCNAPSNLTTTYNNNSTTFTWDGPSSANSYNFEIKQHDGMSWAYAEYATTLTTNTFTIQGIMHSLSIDWRVQAVCNSGSSAFTETVFTLPCPEATGLNVTYITSTSAIINWTPAPGYNTFISDFTLGYRVYNSNSNWISLGHTQNTSMTVNNLQPNTVYEFCINQTCPYFNSSPVFGTFTTAAPVCNVPTNLNSSNIGNNSALITWDTAAGAVNYTVELKPSTSSTWVAYTSSTNSFSATNLNMGITYNYRVKTNCANSSSALTAISNFTTQNCVSNGNNNQEWIRLFDLGSISRSSGKESGGYINATNSTNLIIGSNRNAAKIRAGYTGSFTTQYFSIYIDFDQDGIYENNELVYGPDDLTNGNTLKFKIDIPSNINAVSTGMRVIMARGNANINGCLIGFNGETEDYRVNLIGGSNNLTLGTNELDMSIKNKLSVYPNPTQSSVTIDLSEIVEAAKLKVVNIFGQIIIENNDIINEAFAIDLSSLNNGIYFVIVDDKKGNTYSQKIIKQ